MISDQLVIESLHEVRRQAKACGVAGLIYCFGEPYPGLLTILADLQSDREIFQALEIVTDMKQEATWWCSFIDATISFHRVNVTANWHSSTDVTKHRKQFSDKAFILLMHHMNVTVNILMIPECWDGLIADANYFYDRGLDVVLKTQEGVSYSEQQLATIRTEFVPRNWIRPPSERPFHILSDDSEVISVEISDRLIFSIRRLV